MVIQYSSSKTFSEINPAITTPHECSVNIGGYPFEEHADIAGENFVKDPIIIGKHVNFSPLGEYQILSIIIVYIYIYYNYIVNIFRL